MPEAGYDYDPYDTLGEHAEILTTPSGVILYDGPFSTYREIHISVRGIAAGLRAGTFSNVPPCPPLWQDEGQYWDGCSMIANVIKCNWPGVLATLTASWIYINGIIAI
jgi:hypothetical protein